MFCHTSQRLNEHSKMWEIHANDYWIVFKMADLLSLIPRSFTFQDGGWLKFPTLRTFRMSNSLPTCSSRGLYPPPILGQTIDRCIKKSLQAGFEAVLLIFLTVCHINFVAICQASGKRLKKSKCPTVRFSSKLLFVII